MCGAAAGGSVCSIARLIARPFTSWSDTTPAPNFGTESSRDAHPSRPVGSAVTRGAETDGREAERDRHRASEDDVAGQKHRRVVRSTGPSIAGRKARTDLRRTKMTKTLLAASLALLATSANAASPSCKFTVPYKVATVTMVTDEQINEKIKQNCPKANVDEVVCIRVKNNFLCTNDVK